MEERRTTSSEGGLLLAPPITLSKPDLTPFISVYKGPGGACASEGKGFCYSLFNPLV